VLVSDPLVDGVEELLPDAVFEESADRVCGEDGDDESLAAAE
jgi:hypothetical protein